MNLDLPKLRRLEAAAEMTLDANPTDASVRFANELLANAPALLDAAEEAGQLRGEAKHLVAQLDLHHRIAAEVRRMLHNGGAAPNWSQLQWCDAMLRELAGLPQATTSNLPEFTSTEEIKP